MSITVDRINITSWPREDKALLSSLASWLCFGNVGFKKHAAFGSKLTLLDHAQNLIYLWIFFSGRLETCLNSTPTSHLLAKVVS